MTYIYHLHKHLTCQSFCRLRWFQAAFGVTSLGGLRSVKRPAGTLLQRSTGVKPCPTSHQPGPPKTERKGRQCQHQQ